MEDYLKACNSMQNCKPFGRSRSFWIIADGNGTIPETAAVCVIGIVLLLALREELQKLARKVVRLPA